MGWFDEQIRQRIQHDDEAFCMAMAGMADVIMDQKLAAMLADDRIQTQNAIEEILKYYHIKPRDVPDTIADLNDQLEFLMRPSGIMRRRVQLKGEWYKEAIGPMLGAWKEDGRAAALIPGKQDEYLFLDETGRKTRITAKNAKEFASEAICFYRPLPSGEIHIPDLLKYMVSCLSASDWIFTACAAGAAALIGMLVPYINQLIYGRVIESQSLQLLFAIAGFLICVTVSQTMMETVKTILLARISTKLEIQVQAAGMMRLLSLPASFFKDYAAGDLAGRMNYLTLLCSSLTNTVLTSGLTAIFSLVYIVQMIQYGPGLAGPGLIVILFTICFSLITTLIQARVSRRTMEASVKESGLDYAFISGVQKIKLAGAEKRAFSKWAQAYTKVAKLTYDPPMILKISPVVTTSLSLIGTIVIYYAAIKNGTALADYFAFNSAYAMVTGAFSALVTVASLIAQVQPILGMLEPILQTPPEVEASKRMVSRLSGAVELNNVSFRYRENMPLIADNLSLKIRPGQYVAIVGKTGCGKSTLMRLLLGFETPQKGAIYYDGKDLSSMDLKSLRQHIGTVMQDGKLFQGGYLFQHRHHSPAAESGGCLAGGGNGRHRR